MLFEIVFQFSYKVEDADWSRDMRGKNVISAIPLRTWLVLYTSRDAAIAQDFVQTLERVNPPMGIKIDKPEMYVDFVNICVCFCLFIRVCVCACTGVYGCTIVINVASDSASFIFEHNACLYTDILL